MDYFFCLKSSRAALVLILFICFSVTASAQNQTIIHGKVTDAATQEPLIGVNIRLQGKMLGTTTGLDGSYRLTVKENLPLRLLFTTVGFEPREIVVEREGELNVALEEQTIIGREVVVSASRVEENILQSPVSIEKMGILEIRNTASDSYYKGIANLKGVDVTTSSINFQIINARGFNSTGNTRFVQLVDGMDTQAPALNFPIGNLNGPSQLDVESVELIPGASSALYGPNAFNGILLINSKSPFQYRGISAMVQTGMNHIGGNSLEPANPQPMYEASFRYATAFKEKVAVKINFSYQKAEDWYGTNMQDRYPDRAPSSFNQGEGLSGNSYEDLPAGVVSTFYRNPGANLVHGYGDDAAVSLTLVGFSLEQRLRDAGLGPYLDAGDVPGLVVSRTPYLERDLVDYNAENLKANAAIHYRPTSNLEAIYQFNYGYGTSIYTGAQRYSLKNFSIGQHKLELRGDNFFVRGYTTQERSGDSYIADFLALQINREWALNQAGLTDEQGNPLPGVNLSDGDGVWFGTYLGSYLGYLALNGIAPGAATPQQQQSAHFAARQNTDLGRYQPGSPEFERAAERYKSMNIPNGALFQDATNLWHADAQYDFKNEISWLDLQVGASYRLYELNSNGTIFADSPGSPITIREYGGFVQAARKLLEDRLKLTGSLRYDKNENFDGQLNPRISGVYTFGRQHNIRASAQTGFRNPTTQGQHINLSTGAFRILGGLPQYWEEYDIFTNAYTARSVNEYIAAVNQAGSPFAVVNPANLALLQKAEQFEPVKPEQIRSFEIGYKSLVQNRLMIDAAYYYNIYNDFIAQVQIRKASGDLAINPLFAASLLSGNDQNTFQTYTNVDEQISAQGAALGLSYDLTRGYIISGNYNWNRLNDATALVERGYLAEFNTPEHKFNAGISNRKLTDLFGFNLNYRWQKAFLWESSFAQGLVPAVGTVDAQLTYTLKPYKTLLKIGGSNILNERYILNYGGPTIGAIYYVSLTFDQLMN